MTLEMKFFFNLLIENETMDIYHFFIWLSHEEGRRAAFLRWQLKRTPK